MLEPGARRRILAVRLDNVGDLVMLSPALTALRCAWPTAEITLLTSPAGASVVPLLPAVDDVIVHRALWQDVAGGSGFDPAAETRFIERRRASRFDEAFVFTSFSQSPYGPAYAAFLAGVPRRVGESLEFGGALLTQQAPPLDPAAHQVDRNLHRLRSVGLAADDTRLRLALPNAAVAGADALLAGAGIGPGVPFLAVAPGASCPARRYPADRFASAAADVASRTGFPVVVLGAARERGLADAVAAAIPDGATSLAGRTTVAELAAVLARTSLLLGNDSGPMHLADAFGTPMVITFSGTDLESQWRPRHAPARLLRRATA
ncbi:MAG: glycosyltransferase family 9 protein [Dehalococcoidia bacterium]|nr:glycosyltransferase family 9 protein [Dehalococcoidia bacterium]